MAIFDEKTRGLFCGEALGVPVSETEAFPFPSVAPPSFDMDVYLGTMEKLRKLAPQRLFYSHDGVGAEPDALISLAAENTRIFGDLILKALKEGASPEATQDRVQRHIFRETGLKGEALAVEMAVAGYILYFQRKKLTP